jgi:predicted kinase
LLYGEITYYKRGAMTLTMLILKGLPASGKSTFAKETVAKDPTFVRINKDDIRSMAHADCWSGSREKTTIALRDAMIVAALRRGKSVIVDDTNFHPAHEQNLRKIAKEEGAQVDVKFFDADVETCVKRDAQRAKSVGEKVIRDMYRKYLLPEPKHQDRSLPWAIIVDMDGTLAIMGDRSPYDDHLAGMDTTNESVYEIVIGWEESRYPQGKVIIVSGRDEGRSREVTQQWLSERGFFPEMLLMRPAGDTRKDSIVKRELYETYIAGKYYIPFVLDDRDQVVRMWRDELGLACLQVAEGNF